MKLTRSDIDKILVWAHAAISGVQLRNTEEDDDLRTRLMKEAISFRVSNPDEEDLENDTRDPD